MRAFIFPGQGSQAVGMGKALAEASPAARAVFQEVDDALGQHLSRLMFEGPPEDLHADRQRPARDHGQRHRDAARAGEGRRRAPGRQGRFRRGPFARRI